MINPDGVIVGNYRCSLSGHDLNRNYRKPSKDTFPTVWHIKEMIRKFSSTNQVLVYCDLHGHSRKQNVFMYGCAADRDQHDFEQPLNYLRNRLFPWLMAKQSPDRFSYGGCKFHIKRCKESTGRVVMYRQLNIRNSYTMEATFCGTAISSQGQRRHFNIQDFEEIGRIFCEVALEYRNTQEDTELELQSLHEMLKYLMEQYLLQNSIPKEISVFNWNRETTQKSEDTNGSWPLSKTEERKNSDGSLSSEISRLSCHLVPSEFKDNDSFDDCLQLMKGLSLVQHLKESDSSSDSDSESEAEYSRTKSRSRQHRKKKTTKKSRNQNNSSAIRRNEDCEEQLSNDQELPAISSLELNAGLQRPSRKQVFYTSREQGILRKSFNRAYPQFVNKYEGRSNGGIPCFAEERLLYRAAKKAELQKKTGEEEEQKNEENIIQMSDELFEMFPPFPRTDSNALYCTCHQTMMPLSVQSLISSRAAMHHAELMWQLRLEEEAASRHHSFNENGDGHQYHCIKCRLPQRLRLTSTFNEYRHHHVERSFHPFSSANERYSFPLSAHITSSRNVTTSANRNVGQQQMANCTDSNSRSCFQEPLQPEITAAAKPDRKLRSLFRPEEQVSLIVPSIHQLQLPSFKH